ncbi:MAG: DNA mismatch repair protein MutS [Oscillospiraceae bacterium]|jgi:DNA mismatch repair protein MutS|nr:DNA mismatch repair protein MutS [Oscillospiraceae bacterium]
MAELTPMMQQYREIKGQNPDAILMYRLGDFYEMFFEDALLVSRELDLVLTGRDCGLEERAPMCGVPYHSVEGYIARLVAKGYKIAVCEQMEDPALAKGLVRREVIRVITPGTVIESEMLDEARNNYLCSVLLAAETAGLCFCDISTGNAEITQLEGADLPGKLINELAKYLPTEVLLNPAAAGNGRLREHFNTHGQVLLEVLEDASFDPAQADGQFPAEYLAQTGCDAFPYAMRALGAALGYLRQVQPGGQCGVRQVECYGESQFMRLDSSSRRNLELCETMRAHEKRGSLLWVLDKTRTAMGKRLLRTWLERPLTHLPRITRRLSAVEELVQGVELRLDALELLSDMHDLERLMARVIYQTANARELQAVAASLALLPGLKAALQPARSELLTRVRGAIDPLEDMCALIGRTLVEEPPASLREGGLIREGYCRELDELRGLERDGKGCLVGVQQQEQDITGIKKLKVGYNRVFGYYIEVSNAYKALVPQHYIRKQTLANCERYITPELKDLEAKVLGAGERIVKLEQEIFSQLREELAGQYRRIRRSAGAVAELDVLCSLAEAAAARNYCRPEVNDGDAIEITEGRHPVVELMLDGAPFVSNNTSLSRRGCRCAVITGPNMAGKSTYMRQVALITLMAQVGSFVPAERATIGMADAIFTRVGASDDLASGQSTFMVEMKEVAQILQNATPRSLLIFDEIGRGTSTFDGMSIARAVLEHAADPRRLGAKTLFATHYHELTELEGGTEGVCNFAVAVKKRGDDVTFLRRIVRGAADGSYGVEVAKLAGVPDAVIRRAKAILHELEAQERAKLQATGQAALYAATTDEESTSETTLQSIQIADFVSSLQSVELDTLTPLEALTRLYDVVKQAREIG